MLITSSPMRFLPYVDMENCRDRQAEAITFKHRQNGVVLVIALIILVAMTLAGIALVRSVDTTNIIAGNLAFQQSATHSGEGGIEAAIGQIEGSTQAALQNNGGAGSGYFALTRDADSPAANVSWDDFWTVTTTTSGTSLAAQAVNLAADANGNAISYVIQRLCYQAGAPLTAGCATVKVDSEGNSHDPTNNTIITITQYYYRITARVAGPRNTVSFIQMIVSR